MNARFPLSLRRHQHGAAAIEFALLFMLFFVVFYALVSYAIAMMLQESFQHAAEEGARAALAVDPLAYSSQSDYVASGVEPQVRSIVGTSLNWLPAKAKTKVLGTGNANVGVSVSGSTLTVEVAYTDYVGDPLLPILIFPVIGTVPKLPDDLSGKAVLQL
jgi:Flp pilus assembly protein TadG